MIEHGRERGRRRGRKQFERFCGLQVLAVISPCSGQTADPFMFRCESCTSMQYSLMGIVKQRSNIRADIANRMLEDPTYAAVVRWGDEGDSFVVLEVKNEF